MLKRSKVDNGHTLSLWSESTLIKTFTCIEQMRSLLTTNKRRSFPPTSTGTKLPSNPSSNQSCPSTNSSNNAINNNYTPVHTKYSMRIRSSGLTYQIWYTHTQMSSTMAGSSVSGIMTSLTWPTTQWSSVWMIVVKRAQRGVSLRWKVENKSQGRCWYRYWTWSSIRTCSR